MTKRAERDASDSTNRRKRRVFMNVTVFRDA